MTSLRIRRLRALLTILVVVMSFWGSTAVAAPPNALGIRPVWGACGIFSEETKLVYDHGFLKLRCGNTSFGYRHIKANHRAAFETLAQPAGRTWEDLLHFALAWNQYDPDEFKVNSANNKACRSRVLFMKDSKGRVVSSKVYKVIYVYSTGKVITAFPTGSQCTYANVGLTGPQPLNLPAVES